MKSSQLSCKASKGTPQVKSSNNRLQLVFTAVGKRHYLSLGLTDTPENRKLAEAKARLIESDIAYERFDPTLAKYKAQVALSTVTPIVTPSLTLAQLWERYTDFRSSQVERTTLLTTYKRTANHIKALPTKNIGDAIIIRDYLVNNFSVNTAKRILIQISACCSWATKSKLISINPFGEMASEIIVKGKSSDDINPFTAEERDKIIAAFSADRYYKHYANFVRFLFMTGCRTGEAIALQWKHISSDCKMITFAESVNSTYKIRKDTKTHKSRKFPCNIKLQAFLLSIKPENCEPEQLVFSSPRNGKEIDAHNFLNRAWKSIMDKIGIPYRPQYNTRHTFVTLALQSNVTPQQVAKWVGNSAEIIMKNYAGTTAHVLPPEF